MVGLLFESKGLKLINRFIFEQDECLEKIFIMR